MQPYIIHDHFLWYLLTFYAVHLISHFLSLQTACILCFLSDQLYSFLQMTQTFIIFLDSCVLFLENSTCFCLLGPLSHLSNVIHSSSNCVFFLPSHKTFEVKFPLWLKDKVEFLACLNMLIQWVLRWSAYYFWNSGEKTIQTYKYYLPSLTF